MNGSREVIDWFNAGSTTPGSDWTEGALCGMGENAVLSDGTTGPDLAGSPSGFFSKRFHSSPT